MRSNRGELLSTVCALGLLICMFAFAWYGGAGIPGVTPQDRLVWTQNAWEALTVGRWLLLVTIAVALGSLVLHFSQRSHGARTNTSPLVALLGVATAILLSYQVLIEMPAANRVIDQKLGAVLGTLLAVGIAVGGLRSIQEERSQVGGKRSRRLVSGRGES